MFSRNFMIKIDKTRKTVNIYFDNFSIWFRRLCFSRDVIMPVWFLRWRLGRIACGRAVGIKVYGNFRKRHTRRSSSSVVSVSSFSRPNSSFRNTARPIFTFRLNSVFAWSNYAALDYADLQLNDKGAATYFYPIILFYLAYIYVNEFKRMYRDYSNFLNFPRINLLNCNKHEKKKRENRKIVRKIIREIKEQRDYANSNFTTVLNRVL